jgi:hypothetical protein
MHCRAQLAHALTVVPALIEHIRGDIGPKSGRRDSDRPGPQIRAAAVAPTPLDVAAVDTADRLYAELVSWVGVACTDLGLTGPTPGRTWRTVRGAGPPAGQPAGLPAGADGADAGRYARWLLTHLDRIVGRPWVVELLPDVDGDPDPDRPPLVTAVAWTAARWPIEDRPRWLPTPCPGCDLRAVRYHPPSGPGLPAAISCQACGHVIPEHCWDPATQQAITEHAAADRARDAFLIAAQGGAR